MTVHLQCLFVNTLFLVVEAYHSRKILLPGAMRASSFPHCSDPADIVRMCRDKMISFLRKSGGEPSLHYITKYAAGDFENCLMHRQEFTLREYVVWCEHKSSVIRKVSVCFRYIIDKHAKSLSKSVISKGIQKLQDCIISEQEELMGDSIAEPMEEWTEGSIKKRAVKKDRITDPDRRPVVEGYEREEDIKGSHTRGRVPEVDNTDMIVDEHDSEDMRPHIRGRHPDLDYPGHPDIERPGEIHSKGTWSYPVHDQAYYYPRREKGLGNETAQSDNKTVETPPTTIEVARPLTKPLLTTPPATEPPGTTRK